MARRDAAVAAVTLAFGAAAAYESSKLPFGTVHNPGPAFFPWWTSATITSLGLVLLAQTLTSDSRRGPEGGLSRIAKVGALLAVLAGYVLFLEPLGYLLCTFLLILFMLRVTDPQRWAVALSLSAIAAVGSYVLFATWLSVPLPRGLLLR